MRPGRAFGGILPSVSGATQLCPSCAGQLTEGAASCPWCGLGLTAAEPTRVAAAAPTAVVAHNVGLGEQAARPLPSLPPPPKSLPLVQLNPTQVFLRAIIVLGGAYLLFTVARQFVEYSACAVPTPLCR